MDDCVFCKIIKGELPSTKLYEDEHVVAFLDIMPAAKCHSLVAPKKHHGSLLDVPHDDLLSAMKAVQKIGAAVVKATGADGFNVIESDGRAAGQVIRHVHFHIIPRKEGDGLSFSWQSKAGATEEELKDHQKRIKKHM